MLANVWEWLVTTFSAAGIVAIVGFLFRDALASFFSKVIETRFEKQMETFKAELRDKENELGQIMSFLTSARRERDSALQTKRLEAAEILLRLRQSIGQLSMLVEYMKILNTDELLKKGDDKAISEFAEGLIKPFDVDGVLKSMKEINRTLPQLYLSEETLKIFDAYESIIMNATMMMKVFSIPLSRKADLIKKTDTLSKKIIDILPGAKEGFDKFGESYAYYWSQYFYDEILRSLRNEVAGTEDTARDAKSIERLALDSRQAQANIRASLESAGLPDSVINSDQAAQTAVERATQ